MEKIKPLAEARNSTEAINIAYHSLNAMKSGKDVLSMNAVCAKAGIPSRGYFSLVMNGKRILSRKHGPALARVLGLKGFERDLFLTLLDADHATESTRRRQLKLAIASYRKLLAIDETAILPENLSSEALVGDVFCSFSLFPNGADQDQLLELFPRRRHAAVKGILKNLCKEGYLKKEQLTYHVVKKGTIFLASSDKSAPIRYISSSFFEVAQLAPRLMERLGRCYLTSLTISMKSSEYPRFLESVKEAVKKLVVEVNDDAGDQIVRVNVGVHPAVPAIDAGE